MGAFALPVGAKGSFACLVGGNWVEADSGKTCSVTNPADGDEIARVPDMAAADTQRAIDAADAAAPAWARKTGHERAALLRRMHELTLANMDGIAVLLSAECGKPFEEAKGEVKYAADFLEFYAEEARRVYGEVLVSPSAARRQLVLQAPVGPAALLTPWNFSAAMPARKIAPALAAGCTVVLRPSSNTPLCALVFARIAEMAGVPAGVVNVVISEDHAATAGVLCSSPQIKKLSFTGSTRVGKLLLAATASTIKRTSMELGGKAPFIVFADADLEDAIEGAVASKFRNAGQTCVCANTFYVHASLYSRFVEGLTARVAALTVGDGMVAGNVMGPLISSSALARMSVLVADAVAKGARVTTGGKPSAASANGSKGWFFAPTVLADVTPDMTVVREEIFGPIAPVATFEDEATLLSSLAADPERAGLSAYFYTRDNARTWRVAEELGVGIVGVNTGLVSSANAPFGGVGESGFGREGARQGIQEYLSTKYIMMGV